MVHASTPTRQLVLLNRHSSITSWSIPCCQIAHLSITMGRRLRHHLHLSMTTGRRRHHLRRVEARSSSHSREIPREMLQKILVKLPIKDVAWCCCVLRLWRSVVSEPSFLHLHAANYATALSADAEVLFVLTTCEPGRSDEASIFNMSSGKAMFSFDIPSQKTHKQNI